MNCMDRLRRSAILGVGEEGADIGYRLAWNEALAETLGILNEILVIATACGPDVLAKRQRVGAALGNC